MMERLAFESGSRGLSGRLARVIAASIALGLFFAVVPPLEGQYFGRNKVQYDQFEFQVLKTPHFDIHFYPEKGVAIEDVARMAERWYERFARLFQHEFEAPKPLVLYANHPDFQQTNTLQMFLGESTGGVTESLKNRVIMPLTGSHQDTDHVLGHELVHAFQYNIAQSRQGPGISGLSRLPLWAVEGMAEYLSVGRDDPLTAMWIRDAARRDDIPTLDQMSRDYRYFPYRFGQAFWAWLAGVYGDDLVVDLFRRSIRMGWDPALELVLGMKPDTLSVRWAEAIKADYLPLMEGRSAPSEVGRLLLSPSTGSGAQNLAPSVSPDGERLVFMSEKNLFSFDLFLADVASGDVVRTLSNSATSPHFDALRFMDGSGTWSRDGSRLAYVVFAGGSNQIVLADASSGGIQKRISVEGVGAIQGPSWSPDGRFLVFSGSSGGLTDLYLYDLELDVSRQLTDDRYTVFQPVFSPDGRKIAFASDLSPDTDFRTLAYAKFQIALYDLQTGQVEHVPVFGSGVKHINPQFSPDGRHLYFISDVDGFSDIYRLEMETGKVERITNVATAVSGISWSAPAMSIAQNTGEIVFSVFDEFEFHVYALSAEEADAQAQEVTSFEAGPGRNLPSVAPLAVSRVAAYLADHESGLPPVGAFQVAEAEPFNSRLELDFIGQPTIGVGADAFGNYIGGGASAFFSDMLGDRFLGVAVSAQGTVKDIGGQVFYLNQQRRWNWGYAGGRIPYQYLFYFWDRVAEGEIQYDVLTQRRYRLFLDNFTGLVAYPFSMTRRIEANAGFSRYSYDIEDDQIWYSGGLAVDMRREQRNDLAPDPLNLFQASVALVGDNSFSAFTSPVRGGRYRLELQTTNGTANFQTVIADYRRYFSPSRNLTVAVRGLHYGRYNYDEEVRQNTIIRPLFLGYETLIRGYSWESFSAAECGRTADGSCPTFDRLFGHRLGVANLELRLPFIGTDQFGLIDLPYVPIELVAFTDVGIAWDDENRVDSWKFSRSSTARIPLVSSGVSARMNILGILILEAYYAHPWQRPDKGWHWGFNLAPGW
jgi:WD40 repeat protein